MHKTQQIYFKKESIAVKPSTVIPTATRQSPLKDLAFVQVSFIHDSCSSSSKSDEYQRLRGSNDLTLVEYKNATTGFCPSSPSLQQRDSKGATHSPRTNSNCEQKACSEQRQHRTKVPVFHWTLKKHTRSQQSFSKGSRKDATLTEPLATPTPQNKLSLLHHSYYHGEWNEQEDPQKDSLQRPLKASKTHNSNECSESSACNSKPFVPSESSSLEADERPNKRSLQTTGLLSTTQTQTKRRKRTSIFTIQELLDPTVK
ncbi:hypothetical protein C9374_000585 [Naegleria lovaniensis]|uniref:Uncharacterized protein n=1 Tax=Naegleria lovaniensis TaxID=51637 RepID=A0AA88KP98_NAELO|nr:uncharacterized protein C9374_000585 [Naegleria lovaniensis]KAG2388421.1 hypothetical protein C9374_000585 [Naegleria lovaniensis]